MKKLLCLLPAALTAVFCLSSCSMFYSIVPPADLPSSQIIDSRMDNSGQTVSEAFMDTSDASAIYQRIRAALTEYNNTICFSGKITHDTITEAVDMLRKNDPDIFWLNGYSILSDSKHTEIEFRTLNEYTPSQLKTMHTALISAADNIIEQIPENGSDYDKILFVHDYLIHNTVYDSPGAASVKNGIWGTSYGCLVNSKAVCQGYAEAFMYIMNRIGIESGITHGETDDDKHAWNYVKLDDEYYWIDVTWDDPIDENSNEDNLRYTYFLINDEMLMRSRTINKTDKFVPVCKKLDNNYFVRNGCYLTEYSVDSIGKIMAERSVDNTVSIMFADEASYLETIDKLIENAEIWQTADYVQLGGEVFFAQDDEMYIITIKY